MTTQEQSLPGKPPIITILHDSPTALGHLTLRKRYSAAVEREVFEMTVEGELMMSSAIAVSEQALAECALRIVARQSLRVHPGEEFIEVIREHLGMVTLDEVRFEKPCLRQPEVNYLALARPIWSDGMDRFDR